MTEEPNGRTDREGEAGPAAPDDERSRYRRLVEENPAGLWVVRNGDVEYANRACAELFGYSRAELRGRSVAELVAPEDRDALLEAVRAVEAGRVEEATEVLAGVREDGDRFGVAVHAARADAGGEPAVVGTVTGVTGRDEDRVQALFEEAADPIAEVEVVDAHAVVRRVNPAFEAVFGVDGDALRGEPLDEHVVPDDELEEALRINLRAEGGEPVAEEVTRLTADGQRDFLLRAIPYDGADGAGSYLVYTDITDRKDRERRLNALQETTRELMEAGSREAVARAAVDAAERVLGLDVASFHSFDGGEAELVPVAATDRARALFDPVPTIGQGEGIAWYVYRMGDPFVTDDVRAVETVYNPDTPVRSELIFPVDDHGVFMAGSTAVGAIDDVDESLARMLVATLKAALDRAEREALLREREEALVQQNERLEEFAGVVSHDLRGPLAVVKGNVHLLRQEGDEKYVDRIEAAADRMDDLIEDLLALARQGATVDEPELVELSAVAEDAWATAETRGATLEIEDARTLRADPGRLQQLLENLFANAVEHGGEDVAVRVGVLADDSGGGRPASPAAGFYVEDDGEGIPDGERDRLFETGFTTVEEGTGFGLAIVRRIAEAHGWEVRATDGSGGGARFEVVGVETV